MRIGIIGSGRIGGNLGRLLALAGHEVMFTFSRDPAKLEAAASDAGEAARAGEPAEAAAWADVLVLSVPWRVLDEAVAAAGALDGKVVVDTINPYGEGGLVKLPQGSSAAQEVAARIPGARTVKAFNTLTSAFQRDASGRAAPERVAIFFAGEDEEAKGIVGGLIDDAGFAPVDVGGWSEVWLLEAPRRDGSVYGEEYREDDAREIAGAVAVDPERAMRLAVERKR